MPLTKVSDSFDPSNVTSCVGIISLYEIAYDSKGHPPGSLQVIIQATRADSQWLILPSGPPSTSVICQDNWGDPHVEYCSDKISASPAYKSNYRGYSLEHVNAMSQYPPLLPSSLIDLRIPGSAQGWIVIVSESLMNPSHYRAIFRTVRLWRQDRGARFAGTCNGAVSPTVNLEGMPGQPTPRNNRQPDCAWLRPRIRTRRWMRGKRLCFWELSSNAVHRCVIRHHWLQPEEHVRCAKMLRCASFILLLLNALMVIVLARKGRVSLLVQDGSFLSEKFGCTYEVVRSQLSGLV